MHTFSLKIPDHLYAKLEAETQKRHMTKSQFIRIALEATLEKKNQGQEMASFYALSKDLCGSLSGGPNDLSTNPKHMEDYGK